MSPRVNFQVNTHLESNLLIFDQFPIEPRSPTQMSSDSSTLSNALGTNPRGEEWPQSINEFNQLQENSFESIPVDIQRKGQNTTSPCDQNILTQTVHPHKTQNLKQKRYGDMQAVSSSQVVLNMFLSRINFASRGREKWKMRSGMRWQMPSGWKRRGVGCYMKASRPSSSPSMVKI